MPYRWQTDTGEAPDFSGASFFGKGETPLASLSLNAHNSLTPKGFVIFIGCTVALILVPLLAVVGSPVLWALLPFMFTAVALIWWALTWSWKDRSVSEQLDIWSDRVALRHVPGRGGEKTWEANTHWVSVHLHPNRGKIKNYITLTGSHSSREVELGSFLTEDERARLHMELSQALAQAATLAPL
ncbi:MAG: DUF2244 domain-containing protein [Pseudomonadota bacterium]